MVDIICLGEPMVEFNQRPDGLLAQGFGGDTSNAAISAARQGASTGYVTRIGNDHFGDLIVELWREEGIEVTHVLRDNNAPTGIYFVTHDQNGHHFSYYRKHSAASRLTPDDLAEDYIAKARVLHVSAISQAISDSAASTVRRAIELANKHGTRVSYDTNLRLNLWPIETAREVIHAAMSCCQVALPSYDDATILTGLDDANAIVDFYLDLGAETVALKQGGKGVIVATPDERLSIPVCAVDSIDANAAGDTFAGAFLAALCRDMTPFAAAQYANAAAALSTTRSGAVTSIPHRHEVETFVNANN